MKRFIKIIALLFVVYSSAGQEYQTSVQFFSVEDGVNDRNVYCVNQDNRGLIWVGTGNGLNRFDGQKFTPVKDNEGLVSSGRIRGIKKDETGIFWIQKQNAPVIRFDPIKEESLPIEVDHLAKTEDLYLLNPSGDSELIYFHNDKGQVFTLDKKQKIVRFGEVRIKKNSLYPKPTSWGTITAYDIEKREVKEFDKSGTTIRTFPSPSVPNTFYDKKGDRLHLVADLDDSKKELEFGQLLFRAQKQGDWQAINVMQDSLHLKVSDFPLKNYKGYHFHYLTDLKSNAWLLVNKTVLYLDADGKVIKDLTGELSPFTPINWVPNQVYLDNKNQLWISTGTGLYLLQVREHPFQHYLTETDHTSVRAIREIQKDRIIAGTYHGTKLINRNGKTEKQLSDICAITLSSDEKGTIWGGIHGFSFFEFLESQAKGEIKPFRNDSIDSNVVYYDSVQQQLFSGSEEGLYLIDREKQTIDPYPLINEFAALKQAFFYHFLRGQEGLWLGTNKGLFLLDDEKGIVDHITFPGSGVFHIHLDSSGDFWLATMGGGLIHWNPQTGIKRQYTTEDGLSHNVIYAVYEDKQGFLWLPCNYGLMRFEKKSGEVVVFLPEDGITHEEFNTWSHHQAKDGRLYFGGLNGFIAFYPEDIEITENEAPFIITQFQQFDSKTGQLTNITHDLLNTQKVVLNPGDKFFTLEFSLLDYSAGDHTYAWRIDGLDKEWTFQTENRIRINALKYGDYNLHIKAKGFGGQWAKNELNIPISVLRPFYLKNSFFMISLISMVLIITCLFRYRTAQLRRNAEKLTLEVAKRTQTISDQNEQLRDANQFKDTIMSLIAHDLRAPLISLRGLSKKMSFLLKKQRIDEVEALGETIDQSTSHVTELLDNLLNWALVQKGSLIIKPEVVCLKALTDETLALYSDIASTKSISLSGPTENGFYLTADKNSVLTILRNLLHNAIKFTPEGGKVEVRPLKDHHNAGFEVLDSGVGMAPDKVRELFSPGTNSKSKGTRGERGTGIGLVLCKELVELNEGSIEVQSVKGMGSRIKVLFPIINH